MYYKMFQFSANQDLILKKIPKELIYLGISAFLVYQYVRRN